MKVTLGGFLPLAICLGLALSTAAEGDDGYAHGGDVEWAGIFETPEDSYIWIAQKIGEEGDLGHIDPTSGICFGGGT